MRVSDTQMFGLSTRNLTEARSKVAELRQQAMEGKRVTKPSDDPVAAAAARRESAREARAESNQRSINAGLAALQLADAALSEMGDALARAKELAIQQANETMSPEDRANAALEVDQLREAIRELANAEAGGRHVFAGYQDGEAPFDATGAYLGDTNAREVEVAPGVRVPEGVTGDQLFGAAGGVDLFAALDDLSAALRANDVDGVRGSLDELDGSMSQLTDGRAEIGSYINRFDVALSVSERVQDHAAQTRSDLVEIDQVESYMGLTQAQTALEAAVQIASQLPLPGLVNRG